MSLSKSIKKNFEREFFSRLGENINESFFSSKALEGLAGFSPPSDFSIAFLKAPLINRAFPKENHSDYCWVIAESFNDKVIEEINDSYFLLYLTAIFLHCNSEEPTGMELSGFYIQKCLSMFWKRADCNGFSMLERLLKNLDIDSNVCVKYFSLVGLLFTYRVLGENNNCMKIYNQIEGIRDTPGDFNEFDDLSYDGDSQLAWKQLNDKLPFPQWTEKMDFNKILFV